MKKFHLYSKCVLVIFISALQLTPLFALDYYWVGGSGLWSDHNNHWATTSGGNVFHDQVPQSMDNVFFDENSFPNGGTVTIDPTIIYCRDMDWTGAIGTPVFEATSDKEVWIYGSLTLIPDMEWNIFGEVHFRAFEAGKTITSAGKKFLGDVFFDGSGGGWTLLDAFEGFQFVHVDGAVNTNGQNVAVYYFYSTGSPSRTLQFDSSNIQIGQSGGCSAYFYVGSEPFNFDAGTSTIYIYGSSTCEVYFYGGNKTYYDIVCEPPTRVNQDNSFHSATFLNSAKIIGSNIFESLTFSPGKTYELASFSTQTITPLGNFIAEGYGGFPIELRSSNLGQDATLHKDGDPICLDFLYMTDIAATGSAFEYAGANSDDVFGNSGWLFEACPGCFDAAPSPAPTLDPTSVIAVLAGQQATLILQGLPPGHEVLWFDADQKEESYANTANFFQPMVIGDTTFYAAYRDLATGCVSDLLPVMVCVVDTPTPGVGDLDGDGIPDACDPVLDVNGAVANLKGYIGDADIDDRIANAIIQRLCLAELKFCDYGFVSSALSALDYLVSYISYQSGSGIPTADADYLITQIEVLSTAIANGNAECANAPGSSARLSGNTWDTDHSRLLQVFPNPAQGELSLIQKEYAGKQAVIMITNNLGVLLRRTEIEEMPAEALTLNLSGLPGGHYFLTLEVEGEAAITKRFVIAR